MSGGYNQASNTTPKPPQIGGGNYNPYKGAQAGAAVNSASVKKTKDVSPLAAYERDHNQQRIFSTYIDPSNDPRQPAVYPQQQPPIPSKNTSHLAANAVKANSRYAPPLQLSNHPQQQSPRPQAGLNFQKNNAVLYPTALGAQSNALTSLNTGAGSALEDFTAQSP